jgi:hypothetical protein
MSKPQKGDKWYWLVWGALFFVKEIPAVMDERRGNTLSEFIWWVRNMRWWLKFAILWFCINLTMHFAFDGDLFWPFF